MARLSVAATLRQVLSDGKPHTTAELADALRGVVPPEHAYRLYWSRIEQDRKRWWRRGRRAAPERYQVESLSLDEIVSLGLMVCVKNGAKDVGRRIGRGVYVAKETT